MRMSLDYWRCLRAVDSDRSEFTSMVYTKLELIRQVASKQESGSIHTALSRNRCCSAVKGRLRLPCIDVSTAFGLASVLGGADEDVMVARITVEEDKESRLLVARRGSLVRRQSIFDVVLVCVIVCDVEKVEQLVPFTSRIYVDDVDEFRLPA